MCGATGDVRFPATVKADIRKRSCLLYPQKWTCAMHYLAYALGHKRTSGGTLDPRIDLAAKRYKIDRLGQKRLSTIFQCLSLCLGIAISGDHDDRYIGSSGLGFRQ